MNYYHTSLITKLALFPNGAWTTANLDELIHFVTLWTENEL
jgi:hypothetical protein